MLIKAVHENRTDIARFLIENGEPVPSSAHLLHVAVANDNREMAELLLTVCHFDDRNDEGRTPLHLVRSKEMAELLLRHGAAADARDASGQYPHDTVTDDKTRELLLRRYQELHPVTAPALPPPTRSRPTTGNTASRWNASRCTT